MLVVVGLVVVGGAFGVLLVGAGVVVVGGRCGGGGGVFYSRLSAPDAEL